MRLVSILLVLFLLSACSEKPTEQKEPPKPRAVVDVHIAIDPEVRSFIDTATQKFKQSDIKLPDGTGINPIYIEIPGTLAQDQIASGKTKVDGWITQRSLVELTNVSVRNLGAKQTDCIPLFATPIVFGASRKTVESLELESTEIDLKTLLRFEEDNKTLGKTGFLFSEPSKTAEGLHALLQLTQIASESTELYDFIFTATGGYNSSSEELLNGIVTANTPHRHFVVTSERSIARFNITNRVPLTALYPVGGTVWHDFQLCRSDVEWVNASKQAAIKVLGEFFAEQGKSLAQAEGFRPARAQSVVPANSILTSKNGLTLTLPSRTVTPATATTLQAALKKWELQRRPLSVVFVLDTSGSIEETGLGYLMGAVQRVSALLSVNDMVSLVSVSTDATVLLEPTSDREAFGKALTKMESIGGTALYDGVLKGMQLGTRRTPTEYRSVVIAVSDGPDKNSKTSPDLIRHSIRQAIINRDIPLYFVTLSDAKSDFSDLKQLAPEMYAEVIETKFEDLSKTLDKIWQEQ